MIETGIVSKVKVQDVIVNQLPEFIRDESYKAVDFLKQYYISQEYQGGPSDFSSNLDQYLDVKNLTPEVVVDSSTTVGLTTVGAGIVTVTSTKGFPNQYGLLKIDDEIVTYTGITTDTFTGCVRGFSGITSYHSDLNKEDLVFTSSVSAEHAGGSTVQNLSSLFLKEFYKKFKKTFLPGLEERDFSSSLDVGTFIKEARSLYQTKGTEESFRILFNVLYGLTPKILNLEEKLIKPSFANYVRRRVCIAELLSGNPISLKGQSLLKGLTGQALFRSDLDVNINASISEIEPFERVDSGLSGITTYYKIGLFVGYDEASDVKNDFIVVPNTKALETVSAGSSVITVDSTVGFGTTGIIVSGMNTITYSDKTVNQFLNCTGVGVTILPLQNIRSDVTYFGFEDGDLNKKVTLRLTGVMSDFDQDGNLDVSEGEIISVRSLGDKVENPSTDKTYKQTFCNSWIYNTRSSYFITSADGTSFSVGSPVDKSSLKKGDYVEIVSKNDNSILWPTLGNTAAFVEEINDEFTLTLSIGTNSLISQGLISDKSVLVNYKLRKILNKAHSDATPIEYGNGVIISDIQNVYTESENAYVTSNSLPSFVTNNGSTNNATEYSKKIDVGIKTASLDLSDPLSLSDGSEDQTNFTTLNFPEEVPFNDGDKVFYTHTETGIDGLESGSYYVAKTGTLGKSIKLYSSPAAIDDQRNLTFNSRSGVGTANFVLFSQKSGIIGPQKLIKKFPLNSNISDGIEDITPVGQTGMLINGVEISNYKSLDKMFFGPLNKVETLNNGENYDVINLPKISVSSGIGTNALVQPVVSGEFKDVFVDAQTFDIDQVVSIGVTGGNGTGCILEPVVSKRFRQVLFDTRPSPIGGINTVTNRILCNNDHGFSAGETVIYDSFGNQGIGTGSGSGTQTLINRSTYYVGLINSQTIRLHRTEEEALAGTGAIPFNGKNVSGEHAFKVSLRNTISDVIVVDGGSGYTNRQLFVKPSGISTETNLINFDNHGFKSGELIEYIGNISGLDVSNSYYVTANNINSFSLSDAGIGGTDITNYERGKIVNLQSTGVGIQTFKYPDIKVFAEFTAVGVGTTVIGGNVVLGSGQVDLSFTPVVRGSIEQTYLYEPGTGYGSTTINNHKKPLVTLKNGKNASLSPIIVNGQFNSVRVNYGGTEFFSLPDIEVIDPTGSGNGARLKPVLTNAGISTVIVINPGIGYSTDTSIKVKSAGSGAFFDAEVRSLTINKHDTKDDYQLLEDQEGKLKYSVTGYSTSLLGSSDIIGWAYDGNPIYGPFGSSDPTLVSNLNTRLKSGYSKSLSNVKDRPVGFPSGFFVEDHVFDDSGDLDEYNGRYENTKDFPNGAYVYHATLDSSKQPEFPYFIGNSFRSKVIEDNFSTSDQSNFDFNSSNLLRNTFPYKVADDFANNDFIVETNEIKDQKIEIESISSGSITGFNIVDGGDNYKVNEFLNFDETNTSGSGLISLISRVEGKTVNSLETTVNKNLNSVIVWSEKQLKVFTSDNHNFKTNDVINISGVSTDLSFLNNQFKIEVENFTSRTISTISSSPSAGFTTEIFVSDIPKSVSVGSSITIGSETLKILNIYNNLNVLTVKRHSSLFNTTHAQGSNVNFLTNKFTINESVPSFESSNNRKIFFNPSESVGLTTDDGSQQVKSFFFAGKNIVRNVPVKQIYIENHGLNLNQKIKFTVPSEAAGGKISISTDKGISSYDMPEIVFAVPKSINTIGIKTQLCKSDETPEDEVHFMSLTSGNYDNYSFETQLDEVTCKVDQIKTEITTSEAHGLETGDNISLIVQPNLSVGIGTSTAVRILRDSFSGNILINPIGFSSAGVNTSTNSFNIENHELKTGDKVKYESNLLPQGLENKNYFVFKIDDDNIKLCDTFIDSQQIIPSIVGIGSTGGSSQSISLINPRLNVIKNNDLIFDLSNSSLSGYQFKLYYDEQFSNEFISVPGISPTFSVGFGTTNPGNGGAKLTLGYGTSLPNILYYNLEKSGTISTIDTEVRNNSEIIFNDSSYTDSYSITKVGLNTFSVFVKSIPEKLSYTSSECDSLKYNTNSKTPVGAINKIKIISDGSNYKKLPRFIGVGGSSIGEGAVIVPTSEFIGKVEKIRVINEGYEYSSDKTLEPESLIAKSVNVINTDTLGIVSVTNGGAGYIDAPNIIVVDSDTGQEIKSGFLEPVMLENSIASLDIIETPIGLPSKPVTLRTVNNTNGIVITDVISNNSGIFTCRIATPNPVFPVDPFVVNDKVFIEGIQKVGTAGSGFNSSDYGFNLLKVTKYEDNVNAQGQVTIDVTEFTSDTGTAVANVVTFASIVNEPDYPTFLVEHIQSKYNNGEKLLIDRSKTGIFVESDLTVVDLDTGKLKIFGRDSIRKGDVISGTISGSQSEVSKVTENIGRLKTDFSVLKSLGWNNSIGKLNEDFQVLPNNDYFQNMSYSIQSPIEWRNLRTVVNNLVHTSGMKNFADVGVSSAATAGISTDVEGDQITVIMDVFGNKRVDEIKNIDSVRDVDVVGDTSRFLQFDDQRLSDFINCKTNDVLVIDDLSDRFTNLQGNPDDFISLIDFPQSPDTQLFNNLLIVTSSNPPKKLEISELMVISNGSENVLVQKSNLINSGPDLANRSEDNIVEYSLDTKVLSDVSILKFRPKLEPNPENDLDYDLKIFTTSFNTNVNGIGTTSIGPINLNSRVQNCAAGITTDIISVPTNKFDSLYATIYVFDSTSKKMNLVESYVSHKDADSFLTESYFNGEKINLSLNKLGIVTSNISSGNLILSYENKQSNNLKLKSRIIGIGTTGVADGKHRFKTAGQEDGSERTSLYSGISTSNVGISTLELLDSAKFNAVKSVVEVSIGSSKAIHEVLFMHDGTDAYAQQSGSLSLTKNFNSEYDSSSGLGTFGATLSGSNFTLEFHPDNISGISTVVSLNHCFYTKVDLDNTPQDLNYGPITDNHSIRLYNSLTGSRITRTQFTPTVNSIPLYGKVFNPDSVGLNTITGQFSINDHFFRENEELVYKPNSTFVGVGSTPMQFEIKSGGISTIGELPTKVFAKNVTKDSFFISTTRAGTAVTFIGLGEGNAHEFSMKKANEKSLFIIDDVAQYPLLRTNVTHTLNSNLSGQIGLTTNIIHLSGISTVSSTDILKIDNEFVEVVNVGFATTGGGPVGSSGTFNTVEVKRAFVGSAASTHSDGTVVTRFKGSYNIEGRDLFFTRPPRGDLTKTKDENDLDIPTSKFSGRVYLRNDYQDNVIFDDISDQFTGIKSDFNLRVGGANTVGLGTNAELAPSGILFVNGIFQSPSTQFNPNKNFKILESGSGATGVTTVIFTGITSTDNSQFISNNINTNELPRGGVPVSIGNTINGNGYAPLVGANVKALTNASGQITSIVGTAYSAANLGIETAKYDNVTGIMTVRTTNEHPFVGSNDFVLLRDFNFTPSITLRSNGYEVVSVGATNVFGVSIGKRTGIHTYNSSGDAFPFYPNLTFGSGYNEIISIGVTVQDLGYEHRFVSANTNAISGNRTPTDASYDPVSGVLQLTVPNHGLTNSDTVSITTGSIFFSCARDHFQTVHPYPRSTDPVAGISTDVTKIDDNKFSLFVGVNVGNGAKVTATAGIGGTAIFTIVSAGSSYKDPIINVSGPSYSNLSVRGISRIGDGLTSDTGTDLRVNAIVTPVTGIGSTMFEVSEYEIVKSGFAFREGDVVEPVGLITATGVGQLEERSRITIDKIYNDSFALWNFGDFDYIDSIKGIQDGKRTNFSLVVNNQLVSVELDENTINSNVDLENVFFVTVNGVIQEPKKAYTIVGGNIINFAEPPVPEDDITILFYKGTTNVDSNVNLAQKLIIEPGDEVQVRQGSGIETQEKRTVFSLDTSKKLETNPYIGAGISSDVSRSLNLIKQKEDKVINKVVVSKKRSSIEPRITPVAKVISDVTLSNPLELFVDNANIFNYEEDSDPILSFKIFNLPDKAFENAKVTANISIAGTVTGFSTSNFGFGYTNPPTVKLTAPPPKGSMIGVGVGITATATATIGAGGTITKISVDNPGSNYPTPPQVLISSPINVSDISETLSTPPLSNLTIQNNTGIITGIGTTTYNSSLAIKFNIEGENNIISAGRPIYIYDTHVGSGVKSVNVSGADSDIVGIGTTFADNVYVVASFQNMGGGVGVITSIIKSDTVVTGLSTSGVVNVGKYSVGRITNLSRGSNPISIGVTGLTVGLSTALGISTFPTIKRVGGQKTFEQSGAIIPEIRPT